MSCWLLSVLLRSRRIARYNGLAAGSLSLLTEGLGYSVPLS